MDQQQFVYQVAEQEAGCTVYNLLRHKKGFSRSLLRRLKKQGQVQLNGLPVLLKSTVVGGDEVVVQMPPDRVSLLVPENIALTIVYEDQDLLVVHKPAGMLVHPTYAGEQGTLANGVLYYWRDKGIGDRFRAVYRLDRDTSGQVLIARGQHNARLLSGQLAKGQLRRRYLAVVEGVPHHHRQTIDLPLALKTGHSAQWQVSSLGKKAITHYQVLRKFQNAALLLLELETGRTHQIRAHMSFLGHPIMGDARYGGCTSIIGRQALHAAMVDFIHPRSGIVMGLRAPLPQDIIQLLRQLSC